MRSRFLRLGGLIPALLVLENPGLTAAAPAAAEASALAEAVLRSPAIEAARLQWEARRTRQEASGRFPDPEVEAMLSRVAMPDAINPMWEVNVRQPLPKAGERGADRERASAATAMASAELALMAGDMAAEVASALSERSAARERIRLNQRLVEQAAPLAGALDARMASGGGRIAEKLVLESRLAQMRLMIAEDERMEADAAAEARGILGLDLETPLPPFAAPPRGAIAPEESARARLADARGAEARAMARMARASAKPMTAVALRFEQERDERGNTDVLGVAFMSELPWRSRRYALAEQRAALTEERSTRAESIAVVHRWRTALQRLEQAERLAATAGAVAAETSERLGAEYDAFVRSAGTGAMTESVSVLMLLEILERRQAVAVQVIAAEAAVRRAHSELWRFAPVSLFSP